MLALFIALTVALFLVGMAVMTRAVKRDQANNEANATQILDGKFAGQPSATYAVAMGSLPLATVVSGAAERGYRLVGQSRGALNVETLIFERVTD